jgi:hypothetical protein
LLILTASVLFPGITGAQIEIVLGAGVGLGLMVGTGVLAGSLRAARRSLTVPAEWESRATWRMPALRLLAKPVMSTRRKIGLIILRGYLLVAFSLVVVKVIEVAVK